MIRYDGRFRPESLSALIVNVRQTITIGDHRHRRVATGARLVVGAFDLLGGERVVQNTGLAPSGVVIGPFVVKDFEHHHPIVAVVGDERVNQHTKVGKQQKRYGHGSFHRRTADFRDKFKVFHVKNKEGRSTLPVSAPGRGFKTSAPADPVPHIAVNRDERLFVERQSRSRPDRPPPDEMVMS